MSLLGYCILPNIKRFKSSTAHKVRPLKGWWVLGKVSVGEVHKVKMRHASAILTKTVSQEKTRYHLVLHRYNCLFLMRKNRTMR